MEYRNPVKTADGRLNCEINHPVHGWIPFTAAADDGPEYSREIFAEAFEGAADYVAPAALSEAELLTAERAGMVVSRFQARAALLQAGLLAQAEAAVASADAMTQIAWADAVEFRRNSPTIATLAGVLQLSPEELDTLFRAAATIEA